MTKTKRGAKRVPPHAPRGAYRICREGCSTRLIKIVYGMPDAEQMREAEAGRIVLGGCCIVDGAPKWACPKCGARYPAPPEALDAETKIALARLATFLVDLLADRVRSPPIVARFMQLYDELESASATTTERDAFDESTRVAKTRVSGNHAMRRSKAVAQ